MKIIKIFPLAIIIFSLLLITSPVFASDTNGTIDPSFRYAWGENVGFIDFGSTNGNVQITDSALSGYIYGENIGFIDLSAVTNDNEGNLSGYAWGENIGWVDFSKTIIGNDGLFTGSAYGENIGFITFNTNDNNKVVTDWRPLSTRSSSTPNPTPRRSSGSAPTVTTVVPVIAPTIPTISNNSQTSNITRILKLTKPQMKGDDVKTLQNYLNTHLYNCGIADGIFGNLTKQAVIKFQLANQLTPDGIVGPLTKSKMK
jgi:hypothetical protein